ncbi:hypothetical protein [Nostoc piscinale]|uniref:hypothetical protein n=1 Tax=Nostoc piscinale TaxID=224012 RepID=UPI001F23ABF9|nr:hypothetical protein [Nostoc piscinale]
MQIICSALPYYQDQLSISTVDEALQQLSVDELKKVAALLNTNSKPTRKAEIIAVIHRHLLGKICNNCGNELFRCILVKG